MPVIFSNLGPILWKMLEFHVHNTNLVPTTSYVIQGHVAALLNLLSEVAKIEYSSITKYTPLLLDIAAEKWITQCCVLEEFSVRLKNKLLFFTFLTVLVWKITNCYSTS